MNSNVNVFELSKLSLKELLDLKSQLVERVLDMHELIKTIGDDMSIAILEEQIGEYIYRIGLINTIIQSKQIANNMGV
jgi:hypothetical protein